MDMQELLQTFCAELFRRARFECKSVEVRKDGLNGFRVDISLPEAGLAIGPDGEHLRAWQEILEQYIAHTVHTFTPVTIDINNYRWQAEQQLRELAHRAAKEAIFTRQPVKLPAMNGYERRIVHTELALRPDINTESEGEDPNRRVVVKPSI